MNPAASASTTRQPSKLAHAPAADPVGGERAVASTPPSYGIDFIDRGLAATVPVQRADAELDRGPCENKTGLPDTLKAGVESLSGMSLDDVKVHYNSAQPAQLNALAYAQGAEIHVAPGQEGHLPHEAWHVVQQAQGRVQPTMQLTGGVRVNDDRGLEREADVMGARAGAVGRLTGAARRGQGRSESGDGRLRPELVGGRGEQGSVYSLSSSFGDAAVPPKGVVQRDVVDDRDRSKVMLDRFNRDSERAQVLAASLYEKLWRSDQLGKEGFDSLYEHILGHLAGLKDTIDDPGRAATVSELVDPIFWDLSAQYSPQQNRAHLDWLDSGGGSKLMTHEQTQDRSRQAQDVFGHYHFFDTHMVWRFTTTPSTDVVYIAPGTSHEEVARVVAAHSGGADKSNPNVRTLSFGRNLGALMGVAASTGGDKKVLNIIDKAEYLYGIDIRSLARHGISAHPATARLISFFESEYVLVSTPGERARSLEELATVKYLNPFKGRAITEMLGPQGKQEMVSVEKSMGSVAPDRVDVRSTMDLRKVAAILEFAARAKREATKQSHIVMDKEEAGPGQIKNAMGEYTRGLLPRGTGEGVSSHY